MMPTVEITAKEYKRLLARDDKLSALEAGGVDNWEGYGPSLEDLNSDEDEDDEP